MRVLTYLILLVAIFAAVLFASVNADVVSFNYYWGIKHYPLSLLLAISFAIGSLFGLFFGFLMFIKAKRQAMYYKKQTKILEKEIAANRTTLTEGNY